KPAIASYSHQLRYTPATIPLAVEGDLTRLIQVFTNLLDNAAKYTPRGGIITVTSEQIGGGGGESARHRHRHPRNAAAARLRSLRTGRSQPGAHRGRPRHRTGARAPAGADAWRRDRSAERRRRLWRDLHRPDAARAGRVEHAARQRQADAAIGGV